MIVTRTRSTPALLPLLAAVGALVILSFTAYCQSPDAAAGQRQFKSDEVNRIIDRIVAGEKQYAVNLKKYSPRVETYLQFTSPDAELGSAVSNDAYFLGRLALGGKQEEISFTSGNKPNRRRSSLKAITMPFFPPHFFLDRFASSAMVDPDNFDESHYTFDPIGWEYLGDVRCFAIDVHPQKDAGAGAFVGRIWVEDRDYAIVRLNGMRINAARFKFYTHFDCWRENLRPGEWLPVYIYGEESDVAGGVRYKSVTRLWGYDLSVPHQQEEWTRILVEAPAPVHDSSDASSDLSPVESKRRLEIEAERNVLVRLEKARLIAPPGPVDKVVETVLNNLVVSNHLDNLPPLHCRVMLTSPLETFTLRYTIVVSRGLLDVLPDEPSLAMMLAHELAHVALGHRLDTKYAFNDRLLVPDEEILPKLDLAREKQEEADADAKAVEFLKNSPYKDKLGSAGLFLRAGADAAPGTPQLFGAHMGNRMATSKGVIRMATLMGSAPELKGTQIDQIAALPLGSRVQVNAWDGSISFPNRKAVALVDPSEKMSFQITPLYPHLTRYEEVNSATAVARPAQ